MEKNVSRGLEMELAYESVPHHIKEFAGLPLRYYQLSQDYSHFLESFFEKGVSPTIARLEEEIDRLRSLVDEISDDILEEKEVV